MANPRYSTIQTNFTAGEISPQLFGRTDIVKYANGADTIWNFTVRPQGGVTRRSGTRFVGEVKDETKAARLVPFEFSTIQAYILELGNLYMRVYMDGGVVESGPGVPLEVVTPWATADLQGLYFTQSADVLYVCHPDYQPRKISRTSHTAWIIDTLDTLDGPYLSSTPDPATLIISGITDVATLTSDAADFPAAAFPAAVGKFVEYWVEGKPTIGVITARVDDNTVTITPKMNVIEPLSEEVTYVTYTAGTTAIVSHHIFVRHNVGAYLRVEFPHDSGTIYWCLVNGYIGTTRDRVTIDAAVTMHATTGVLTLSNRTITGTITSTESIFVADVGGGTPVPSSDRGRHIRMNFTSDQLWAKIVTVPTDKTVTVTLKDPMPLKIEDPTTYKDDGKTDVYKLGAWSDTTGWPTCCTFHEERLVFAATATEPQTVWMSASSDYENMAPTDLKSAVLDSSGITYTMASSKINAIVWLESCQVLLIGTIGGEWQVRSSSSTDPITPTNFAMSQQTQYGSAEEVNPIRAGNAVVFVQRSGKKVRELAYSNDSNAYQATDMSIISDHVLTYGLGTSRLAYQQEPTNIIWGILGNGLLFGVTYVKDQDVYAWHQHGISGGYDTDSAEVESIATIPGDDGDVLYMIVKRTLNGTTRRFIEFMEKTFAPISETDKDEMFFVDSFLSYTGAPATTFAGLDHLIGEIVYAIADGSELPPLVVDGAGEIAIDKAASVLHVGLPYASVLRTLPLDGGVGTGETSQGHTKRIDKLSVRLLDTIGFAYGTDIMNLDVASFRESDGAMDESPLLRSDDYELLIEDSYNLRSQYYIVQTSPYPLTVLSIMPQFKVAER